MIRLTGAFMVALAAIAGARLEGAQATFQPLEFGQNEDGTGTSQANGISADGSTAVGFDSGWNTAKDWLFNSSRQYTGSQSPNVFNYTSFANGASADGSVIAGTQWSQASDGVQYPYYWTAATGGVYLGSSVQGLRAHGAATGVSANGTVVVGGISQFQGADGLYPAEQAFSWTAAGGVSLLGTLPGMTTSIANGVSANGASVVGSSFNGSGGQEAFLWTSGGMTPLGFLPGTTTSTATAISGNGQVVIGYSGNEAFRWTSAGGMVSIGSLSGTGASEALATSFDGSEIVGESGNRAFLWNQAQGMIDLDAKLLALNPPPYTEQEGWRNYNTNSISGWVLGAATGVSADGTTIVGNGGDGVGGGWIATLPEPSTGVLAAIGCGIIYWWRRRAR